MPDDENNTNNSNNSNNSNSSNTSGGGTKYYVGSDDGWGDEQEMIDVISAALEEKGNTVEKIGVGPNKEATAQAHAGEDNAYLVFICSGVDGCTEWSIKECIKNNNCCKVIFVFCGWKTTDPSAPAYSQEQLDNFKIGASWDAGQYLNSSSESACVADIAGRTHKEYFDANSEYIQYCYSKESLEDVAQKLANGQCGGGGSSAGGNSGGTAQVKDKTFEKCIRRICAATDSIFIVESNAAVLFPYTDWMAFTLRQKINTIEANDIDPDVFSMEYTTDGFYNKVTIAWGGNTLPDRFSEDVNGVMQKVDYATNYTLSNIYNNMVEANFQTETLLNKAKEAVTNAANAGVNAVRNTVDTVLDKDRTTQTVSEDPGTGALLLSEQYDSLVEIYGELEKRVESAAPDYETAQYIVNALLIQYVRDFNNMCKCRALANRKYIGGTFYAVQNPFTKESELFYLNGYTLKTRKKEPMYHDLDFRYGPEGAEEITDYQSISGGGGATSASEDSSESAIWAHAAKFCHQWSCPELRESESDTEDPQTAEDYVKEKESSGVEKLCLSCYGMSAWLYYQFNNKTSIKCQVVGDSTHHVVMVDRGEGMVETRDEYQQLDKGFRWKSSQNTNVLLAAPGGSSSTSGGNTASNNTNSGNANSESGDA